MHVKNVIPFRHAQLVRGSVVVAHGPDRISVYEQRSRSIPNDVLLVVGLSVLGDEHKKLE